MADTTTELEVLDQIVDVLGGQSGQHATVVPVLRQIKELLAAGGAVADGSITTAKLADEAVTAEKLDAEVGGAIFQPTVQVIAVDQMAQQVANQLLGVPVSVVTPKQMGSISMLIRSNLRLVWMYDTRIESGISVIYGELANGGGAAYMYARGAISTVVGLVGVDASWTISSL